MTRRICVVTGTRAEYGLLRRVIRKLEAAADIDLQLIATGMHLSPDFGMTVREIEADGVRINDRIEMLLSSDTAAGVGKSMGLGLIGFSDAFARLKPDLVVVLGDRFEIFAAAAAALVARLPIAHIHGGETTEGAFDEAIRHSVTKMSHLHFVAAEPYRDRVIQLGESPERVFLVGGLGVDAIMDLQPLDRESLARRLGFDFRARNLLVTFHPATLDDAEAGDQVAALLEALDTLGESTGLIFTLPNADTGGRTIARQIEAFANSRPNAVVHASLGQLGYLSCLGQVDAVVGNSSSGLIEAPSFGIATVNIGDRQAGRLKAASVIDCAPQADAIRAALTRALSPEFREEIASVVNPYGEGGASEAIVRILREHPLEGLLKKQFHDLAPTGEGAGGEG
jgi:UDP-hydrolysing UDP-N-acetyl-D-glucosamine 2-epimerase